MTGPFAMLGDLDAGTCVDGVCAVPESSDRTPAATAGPASDAVEPAQDARA